ncbi:hypothetical protein G3O00_03080 [Burkholderia sp. Ac-20384]|uniref:hypothetical protein n=1 Tax=Burkholderia sp. Ac-20384 TaxID=2703902 RepID=UPI0019815AA3|nr:hypothetical protein [Burkholderia sp. Ac-20384]MBN3822601.1 hypothetical protein [Burkholderia sp. Ac-20384]
MKNIADVIERLETGKYVAKKLAAYPYDVGKDYFWHPLGFLVSKLFEEPPLTLRIHIWPRGGGREQNPAWPIHDHIFNMRSWILHGRLLNTVYCESRCLKNYHLYLASYQGDESVLTRGESEISLEVEHEERYEVGQFYNVEAGVFHSSSHEKDATTITVVLTNSVPFGQPRIAGEIDGLNEYRYRRSVASKEEVLNIIREA